MTLKGFLTIMVISTLAAWVSCAMVIFKVDPFSAGLSGFILFYASLWLALTGTISLVGLGARSLFRKEELIFRHVSNSFRQATFLALLVVGLMFFQGHRLLTWWNVTALIAAFSLIEFFAISYSTSPRRQQ